MTKIQKVFDLLSEKIKEDPALLAAIHEAANEIKRMNPIQKMQAFGVVKAALSKLGLYL